MNANIFCSSGAARQSSQLHQHHHHHHCESGEREAIAEGRKVSRTRDRSSFSLHLSVRHTERNRRHRVPGST
ncbi:hypothetical protein AOLI_G00094030 [Acnodon oligacanthus]